MGLLSKDSSMVGVELVRMRDEGQEIGQQAAKGEEAKNTGQQQQKQEKTCRNKKM